MFNRACPIGSRSVPMRRREFLTLLGGARFSFAGTTRRCSNVCLWCGRRQATSSILCEGRTMTDAARSAAPPAAGLAIVLAFLITTSATSRARAEASSTYFGSNTVRVTDEGMTIDRFDRTRFPVFALESLARYFKLGGPAKVITRASSAGGVQDIELVGPSRCLATEIS